MQHWGNGWSALFYSQWEAGMCRNNSQVLSGADEWAVVMLVMFITGQYCPINPFKERIKMRQTWACNSTN